MTVSCNTASLHWMQVEAAETLLLLGEAHLQAGAPLLALPYLLSCIQHCCHLNLDALVSTAATVLQPTVVVIGVQCYTEPSLTLVM